MAIAVFAESYDDSLSGNRQVLFVPSSTEVLVYTRVTDGRRGPHNKWLLSTFSDVAAEISASEVLTAEPVSVYVTAADEKAMKINGYPPGLTTKAVEAHRKAGAVSSLEPLVDRLAELFELVSRQDESLSDLLTDQRLKGGLAMPQAVQTHNGGTTTVTTASTEMEDYVTDTVAPSQPPTELRVSLATVPPIAIAKSYVGRKIANITDYAIFDYCRNKHKNGLLYGPTGPGKTTAIEAWAAERGLRVATVSGNFALEPSHFFGKFISNGIGGFMWIDGPVTDVVRNGGVLLLDEVNFINSKVITPLFSLLDRRRFITLLDHRGEVVNAAEDFTVFATMNPEYHGTAPLNPAFRNRFDVQLNWDYDELVEAKLVKETALRTFAKQLRDQASQGLFETPISTNMLMEFSEMVHDLSYDFAVENFINHFSADEQSSVRVVFQTHEFNIKSDFGISMDLTLDQGQEPGAAA